MKIACVRAVTMASSPLELAGDKTDSEKHHELCEWNKDGEDGERNGTEGKRDEITNLARS